MRITTSLRSMGLRHAIVLVVAGLLFLLPVMVVAPSAYAFESGFEATGEVTQTAAQDEGAQEGKVFASVSEDVQVVQVAIATDAVGCSSASTAVDSQDCVASDVDAAAPAAEEDSEEEDSANVEDDSDKSATEDALEPDASDDIEESEVAEDAEEPDAVTADEAGAADGDFDLGDAVASDESAASDDASTSADATVSTSDDGEAAAEEGSDESAASDDAPALDTASSEPLSAAVSAQSGTFIPVEGVWYVISSSVSGSSLALDAKNGGTTNGTNLQGYTANGTLAQLFGFKSVGGNLYEIVNAASGKNVDVAYGVAANGSNVQLYADNDTAAQRWEIVLNEDGSVTFLSYLNLAYALDLYAGLTTNGTNVHLYRYNGTAAQCWFLSVQDNLVNEGLYTIAAYSSRSMVIDVKNGGTSNGTNVQLYTSNGTNAQKFWISLVSGSTNTYTIESVSASKMLDVCAASKSNGANVQIYESNGTGAQKWIAVISQGGGVGFMNANSGLMLDIYAGKTSNCTNIQQYAANGTAAQAFWLATTTYQFTDGYYTIAISKAKSKLVEVSCGSTKNGGNVQLYQSNDTAAQRWYIFENSDGTYTIRNCNSGKVLDVWAATASSGTNVQQYYANSTAAQRWNFEYLPSSGTFKIVSALSSNLVLDVYAGSTSNGANVQIYTDNGTAAQRFVLTRVKLSVQEQINSYVAWAVSIASDDLHGYDQKYRWNEYGDYDCSSFVISALRSAAISTGTATYTGNMRSQLTQHGFTWLSASTVLKVGDILLNEAHHTAIYIGDGMLVQASINENGGITGGTPGDQTGTEIRVCSYYSRPWDGILRYYG